MRTKRTLQKATVVKLMGRTGSVSYNFKPPYSLLPEYHSTLKHSDFSGKYCHKEPALAHCSKLPQLWTVRKVLSCPISQHDQDDS